MTTTTRNSGFKSILVSLVLLAVSVFSISGLSYGQTGPASLVLDKDIRGKVLIIDKWTDEMMLEMEKPEIKSEKDTLLHEKIQTRFFGEIRTKSTSIFQEYGLLVGGQVGLTFNGSVSIGLAGYGRADTDYSIFDIDPDHDNPAFGGVFFAYAPVQERLLHLRFTALAGSGDSWGRIFYIVEPGVEVVLNVSEIIRLSLGLSYPLTDRNDIGLENPILGFGIQFGK